MQDYKIDSNYKRNSESNSVIDLVTHREKQLDRKKHRLGIKNAQAQQIPCFSDEQIDNGGNHNHKQNQRQTQEKEKTLEEINRKFAKNNVSSKTAFEVPILSVQDFSMFDEGGHGDVAWAKMSSILENDYRIYGYRVDSIADFVKRMSESLGRKEIIKQMQNETNQQEKAKMQSQERLVKHNELASNQVKANLMMHLERNSQNLDINLRKKLMMRKDPLFQRTSRKFDHSSYSSFFMNTLSLSNGLFMQINASQTDQSQNKRKKQETVPINITSQDLQNGMMEQKNQNQKQRQQQSQEQPIKQSQNKLPAVESQNSESLKLISMLISRQIASQTNPQLEYKKLIQKFRKGVQKFGVQLVQQNLPIIEQSQQYQKIISMIMKGQLKSAFEVGIHNTYESSQSQPQEVKLRNTQIAQNKQNIFEEPEQLVEPQQDRPLDNNQQQKKLESPQDNALDGQGQVKFQEELQLQQNHLSILDLINQKNEQEIQQQFEEVDQQQQEYQINMHHARMAEIKSTIKFNRSEQVKQTSTRKKKVNYNIKGIIKSETKKASKKLGIATQMFDAQIKQNFRKVLRKDKNQNNKQNPFEAIFQRNLLPPLTQYNFIIKNVTQLRPSATSQELKQERNKAKASFLQKNLQPPLEQKQNATKKADQPLPKKSSSIQKVEQVSQSEEAPSYFENKATVYSRNQTITKVKQNILRIVKAVKVTNFKNLSTQYNRIYPTLNQATIYIGMLHLANEKYIKVGQMNKKNFTISLF